LAKLCTQRIEAVDNLTKIATAMPDLHQFLAMRLSEHGLSWCSEDAAQAHGRDVSTHGLDISKEEMDELLSKYRNWRPISKPSR